MKDNIKRHAERGIIDALNKVIDDYLIGSTFGTRPAHSVFTKSDYQEYFKQTRPTIKQAKKEFNKERNLQNLLDDIKHINHHLFNSPLEYKNTVRQLLNDVLEDRLALETDKKNEILSFENYDTVNENIVTSFKNFIQ